ncbi:family 1 glycosylhydrolase [Sphingomonas sp. PWP1-2]|uniref:family 1 glycosylhydrolase n=1 Tax=Sphingomonas sp. PWP1-2 TaxID=2804558 RepID=UPI003CF05A1D
MIDRRTLLAAASAMLAAPVVAQPRRSDGFPADFLWGAATAGHQIEGNDTNSDFWLLENIKPTIFAEPVGDACNSLELWTRDLDLAKAIGLNSYRFSIEWSRIEPVAGQFSIALLDHYKAIIAGCHARGLQPVVTFSHWAVPIWFAARGGWTNPESPQLFARYCDRAARHLGDGIARAVTLNEPNGLLIAAAMVPPQAIMAQQPMLAEAARVTGSQRFVGGPAFGSARETLPNLIKAHRAGFAAIKAARTTLPVGFSLAIVDEQAVGETALRDAKRQEFYGPWLETARQDDFVGIQNYSRNQWDATGLVALPATAKRDQIGNETYPASLANCARYVHAATGRPIFVTEHGIATEDDRDRVALIPAALAELKRAIDEGVPVIGYLHWSLIDNFEWVSGYRPKYGLATVDRTTFRRVPKPSAAVLGAIARRNAL